MENLSQINLNLFRTFEAVYTEGNLTRAAEQLCLSQPAISHALSKLRQLFNDPLFIRDAQGVVPTALAIRIRPDIQQALALMRQTVVRSREFDARRDITRITLAMADEIEPVLLPRIISTLNREAPYADISSVRQERSSLRSDLAAGRIDCAIDVAYPVDDTVFHHFLFADDYIVVSRDRKAVDMEVYLGARHITVSSRRTGRSVEDIELARMGVERRLAARCQSYRTACRLVAETEWLLTMPRMLAFSTTVGVDCHILELPIRLPALTLHVFWHRDRSDDPAHQWLRQKMFNVANSLQKPKNSTA